MERNSVMTTNWLYLTTKRGVVRAWRCMRCWAPFAKRRAALPTSMVPRATLGRPLMSEALDFDALSAETGSRSANKNATKERFHNVFLMTGIVAWILFPFQLYNLLDHFPNFSLGNSDFFAVYGYSFGFAIFEFIVKPRREKANRNLPCN